MKFLKFSKLFGADYIGRKKKRAAKSKSRPDVRLYLEQLEDRMAPSVTPVLPEVTVTSASTIGGGFSPQIAVDPTNALKIVEVHATNSNTLAGSYSVDGGTTWNGFVLPANIKDENIYVPPFTPSTPLAIASNPSVTWDRDGFFYVVRAEHDAANTSGAIVLDKFDFSGGSPILANSPDPTQTTLDDDVITATQTTIFVFSTAGFPVGGLPAVPFTIQVDSEQMRVNSASGTAWNVTRGFNGTTAATHVFKSFVTLVESGSGEVLYRWLNQDAAYNPVVGIDTNVPTFTDPVTGTTITDSMTTSGIPKAIYVAWNTNFAQTASGTTSRISVVASADGGDTFTTLQRAGVGSAPEILFTQETDDGILDGGLLTFFWSNGSGIIRDQSSPDGGVATAPVAATQEFTSNGGFIVDANLNPTSGQPDITRVTTFTQTININAVNLTTINDIDVTVNLVHANVDQLRLILIAPNGNQITLVRNRTDNDGTTIINPITGLPQGATGANMGVNVLGAAPNENFNSIGTIFDEEADRNVAAPTASTPYVGHFRPELSFGSDLLSDLYGLTATDLSGQWRLRIEDHRDNNGDDPAAPPLIQFLDDWTIHFTGLISTTGFGGDAGIGAATVPSSATNVYSTTGAAYGIPGVGPSFSIAQDKTFGSFSPFQGRIYVAYTGGGGSNTNVFLRYSDNNGASWSSAVQINDDSAFDNFSEGNRPQFTPTVTVDQSTGTVIVSYYDGRNDAAVARVANAIVASVDGGDTFSPVTYLNPSKNATDFLTSEVVDIGPIPGNQSQAGVNGFGTRQGLVAQGGVITAVYSSNLNSGGNTIFARQATTAAGPRVIYGDMGQVTEDFSFSGFGSGATYNTTFDQDGTRRLDGFVIQFDRPIDRSTFTTGDITAQYQNPNTGDITPLALNPVIQCLDSTSYGPAGISLGNSSAMGMTFFVRFATPQTAVGTYSYAVGSDISDRIRTVATSIQLVGSPTTYDSTDVPMFLPDLSTVTSDSPIVPPLPAGQVIGRVTVTLDLVHTWDGDLAITLISPNNTRIPLSLNNGFSGDNYTNTTFSDLGPLPIFAGSPPFTGTFRPELPLSGLNGQDPAGIWQLEIEDTAGADVGTLNSWSLTITAGIVSGTALPGNQMDQNANAIENEGSVDRFAVPLPENGIPFTAPFVDQTLPLIIPGPHVVSTSVPNNPVTSDNLVLNGTNNAIEVTFDRDIASGSFTSADIISMVGPAGKITGPFSVIQINNRTFRIGFPTQTLSGTYYIVFGPGITDNSGNSIDTDLDAGLDVLRGFADPTTAAVVQSTYIADPLLSIPPKSTVSTTISVPDGFTIQQSALQDMFIQVMLNITHPNMPDLTATLTAPDGTTVVTLFNNAGAFGPNHNDMDNAVLDDSSSNSIESTQGPVSEGPWTPRTQLSVLNGMGSFGDWTLTITNESDTLTGTLNHWEIRLPKAIPSSGLGEAVADQSMVSFRIFTQATTNPQSSDQWTAVGPAATNSGYNSGRIGGLAFDPADPSGNTVFVAGASGGVWKTNNFLTEDSDGPTYVPITDLGPGFSLNIGSLATFGVNNDPTRTVIFAATGEGDVSSSGVGFLRSMDGGMTWDVLDSTTNIDGNGAILPMSSTNRNHAFVGSTSFKVVVDPTPLPNGKIAVYAALSGSNGGIWRSVDSGDTWFRIRAGNATDVVLAAASGDSSGNLSVLYAGFRGEGVYITFNAQTTTNLTLMTGGQPSTPRVDEDLPPTFPLLPTGAPSSTPTGAKGRIILATPALTNNPLQDRFYQGWLYAVVATPGGALDGVYQTKDFGLNWTKLNLPTFFVPAPPQTPVFAFPTNNETRANYDPFGRGQFFQGNYDAVLAVDPNNPNIIYVGGTANGAPSPASGMVRIDTTTVSDPYALVGYSNNEADGGLTTFATTGPTSIHVADQNHAGPGGPFGIYDDYGTPAETIRNGYYNLYRTPSNPFVNPSTLHFTNIGQFNNDGRDVKWMPFNDALDGSTDQHELILMRDPITGGTRLIFGDDQGVYTGVADGSGNLITSVGSHDVATFSRNGNLQISQFYYGAVQPSSLAAQLAGALFYGMAQDDGFPDSAANVMETGNLNWQGGLGDGTGVATDQTGSGTTYEYRWPCCINQSPFVGTDFFLVKFAGQDEKSRTSGLIQTGDNPNTGAGQWPFLDGSNFAVNNYDPSAIVVSSQAGRIFLTAGGTQTTGLGYGVQWHVIGEPASLDSSYAGALAFGAPASSGIGTKNDFIYAGTENGNIFVTFTGGGYNGSPNWRNISAGLDGSAVQSIVTNPKFGSHEAYAVTLNAVYWMQDSSALSPRWVKISDLNTGATTTINQPPAGITATDTTMTVTSTTGFPTTTPFYVRVGTEIIQVTDAATNTWTIVRGANGTAAAAHGNNATVTGISNLLFGLSRPIFNDTNDQYPVLEYLTSLAIDWRFAIPNQTGDNPTTTINQTNGINETDTSITVTSIVGFPTGAFVIQIDSEQIQVSNITGTTWTNVVRGFNGTTAESHSDGATITQINLSHPVLYVAGEGGVYRSRDKGHIWTNFPNIADDGATQEGGWLPNAHVTDLDMSLGNFNTTTGFHDASAGYNMLVATTYGRGTFAIRMDNNAIQQYAVAPIGGPKVTLLSSNVGNGGTTLNGFNVRFGGAVNPATFTTADVTVTGPNGPVAITSVIDISGNNIHNVYQINFTTGQTATGNYTVKIGPDVLDLSGNAMDQNENNVNGENPADIFTQTINFTTNNPPTISDITDKVVAPGSSTPAIQFTIGDAETPAGSLTVTADVVTNPGFTGGTPSIVLGLINPSLRTITLTGQANSHGSALVTVTVTDGSGLSTSDTFTLYVDIAPVMPAISNRTVDHGSPPTIIDLQANDADGDTLSFTIDPHDPLADVATTYGLNTAPQFINYRGANEKYLQSSNNSNAAFGGYYVLMPTNKLYAWLGTLSATLAALPKADFTSPTYSNVDVYTNPALLTSRINYVQPVANLATTLGLTTAAQFYNYRGANEWYLLSSNGSNPAGSGWYVLMPTNKLYAWTGTLNGTLTGTAVADFATAAYQNANVYGNPALLQSQSPLNDDPLVTVSSELYELKTKYGLDTPAEFFNYRGANEWYLHSSNGSNPAGSGYFLLLPNNTLVAWTGSLANLILVADLSSFNVYANPALLTSAELTTAPAVAFSAPNYSPGLPTPTPGGTLTLTPHAAFQRSVDVKVTATDTSGASVSQTFTFKVTNSAPTFLGSIGNQTIGHNLPGFSTDIDDLYTDTGDNSTRIFSVDVSGTNSTYPLDELKGRYGLDTSAEFFNYRGANEWYLHSSKAINQAGGGYYLLIGNKLFAWTGSMAESTSGGVNSPYFVADFMTPFYGNTNVQDNPALLTGATKALLPAVEVNSGPLYDVRVRFGLNTADGFFNYRGLSEKYFVSSNGSNPAGGGYYVLMPTGLLYAWTGDIGTTLQPPAVAVADLSTTNAYNDTRLLYQAQPVIINDPVYDARQRFGLYTADTFFDFRGQGEKYLLSGNGSNPAGGGYYVLMSIGGNSQLREWNGALNSSPVVATFIGLSVYNNPYLLYAATGQALGVTANFTGSNPNTTLNVLRNLGFAGTVRVNVSASDGALKATDTFTFTVTNSAPVINNGSPIANYTGTRASGGTGGTPIDLNDTDANNDEPRIYRATVANNPLYLLMTQYGLVYQPALDNAHAPGARYFLSNNGSNPEGFGYYVLTSANILYSWAGTYLPSIARAPVADFNTAYYGNANVAGNPALLGSATPSDLSSIVTSFTPTPGNDLNLTWSTSFSGQFLVTVYVSDGAGETQRTFLVTVTP
jgi:subtilisin-like proprotein convertase family protein